MSDLLLNLFAWIVLLFFAASFVVFLGAGPVQAALEWIQERRERRDERLLQQVLARLKEIEAEEAERAEFEAESEAFRAGFKAAVASRASRNRFTLPSDSSTDSSRDLTR